MRRLLSLVAASLVVAATFGVLAAPNSATADVDPAIKPDATLKSGQTFTFESKGTMLGSGELIYSPAACRDHPAYSQTCDVFRIVLNRDVSPRALNFAFFSLEFEQIQPPSLVVAVAGLNPLPINDVNLYIWDEPDHYLGENSAGSPEADPDPGGDGFSSPEKGGFTVKKRAYDITVQALNGLNQGYTLRVTFSNERFTSPFEALDELSKAAPSEAAPPFGEDGTFTPPFSDGGLSDLSLDASALPEITPIVDRQISNLGFGINEQLGAGAIDLSGGRRRDVVAVGKAPSGIALVLALLVVPLLAAAGATLWLRRRRASLIA